MSRIGLIVVLAVVGVVPVIGQYTITDRIRAAKERLGPDPGPVVIGSLGEPEPKSLEQLTKESDLVLEARVSKLRVYVNAADTAVITDYAMVPNRVHAGAIPSVSNRPGVATPLVLGVYGGEVVRDGVTVRAKSYNQEALKDGGLYLLFLKRFGKEPGEYQLFNYGAFELSNNALRSFAFEGRSLYKDFINASYTQVTTRIAAAAQR